MINIHSSWGTITCNDKGDVLEKDLCDIDEPCYLGSATRFDVDEFDKWYESFTGNMLTINLANRLRNVLKGKANANFLLKFKTTNHEQI